ncbi:MAG: MFS transporter [Nitrososphaerales archaeon]
MSGFTDQTRPQVPGSTRYETIVLSVVLLGVTMTGIDTTAVVLAIPVMKQDLSSNIISMIWVIMAYLLVITVFGTQVGRLGDLYGRVRVYNIGFGIFTLGSLFCGLAQGGSELVAFRVIQGLGGAMVFSNSGAIIADTISEKKRGRAYGITGIGWSAGAVLGILIGGAVITFLGWRYIFFINIPVGVCAVVMCYKVLREKSERVKAKIDYLGMALFGSGLFFLLYALTNIAGSGASSSGFEALLLGVILIFIFTVWQMRYSAPLLNLSIFRQKVLTASILASFFQGLAGFSVLFLVIMYLQGVRNLTPLDASLLLVPGYVFGAVISPFAGKASDKLGARYVASIGLALEAVGIFIYSTLTLGSPLFVVIIGSVVAGLGTSSFFPANNSAVMANAPRQYYGIASGLLRTFGNVGMVASFALAVVVASLAIPRNLAIAIFLGTGRLDSSLATAFIGGMHTALYASIGIVAVATVLSVLRGKEARTVDNRNS